ncbi:MAG: tetratricopeptide repeat protein, partial [Anaerolineae bacterium]
SPETKAVVDQSTARERTAASESGPAGPRAKPEIKLPTIHISLAPIRQGIEHFLEERRQLRELRRAKRTERTTTVERARLRQALRTLLPGKVEGKRGSSKRTPPPERSSVAAGVSLGVLVLVMLITVSQYLQWGGAAKAEELRRAAEAKLQEAYETQAAEDWYEALDLSRNAVQLDPESQEALELLAEIEQNVDNLEDAMVLNITPLLDLGTTQSPRRVAVADDWVYLLNTATDAVVAIPLTGDLAATPAEGATTILKRGQTYMGEVVNHLVDLAWVEPGGIYPDGAVFIYSEGGTVYIYEPTLGPGSITLQHIQGDLDTGTISALETFGERFYLVDRRKNQILMYEPVNGIYDIPRAYFGTDAAPNLHNALDISIDGRIYLLMGDGDIQTYFAGSHDYSFEIANLPDPDFTPKVMAMEADPDEGLIYLGDPKNERIVVLDKHGDFRYQYRLPRGELRHVEALAIREEPKVLYLIADNKLHAAPLPEVH